MPHDVFVSGFPPDVQVGELEQVFRHCPGYRSVRMRLTKVGQHIAFVEFDSRHDAEEAQRASDGERLLGEPLSVELARSRVDGPPPPGAPGSGPQRQKGHDDFGPYMQVFVEWASHARPPSDPEGRGTLRVGGVPDDMTERECAHIFRPFLGFESAQLRKKESDSGGDVECTVRFRTRQGAAFCAHALDGYRVDPAHEGGRGLRLELVEEEGRARDRRPRRGSSRARAPRRARSGRSARGRDRGHARTPSRSRSRSRGQDPGTYFAEWMSGMFSR